MHPVAYDLLITGATVLTADPARPIVHDATIAISGNRLAFVAALQTAKAAGGTALYDAVSTGLTVLDPTHAPSYGVPGDD